MTAFIRIALEAIAIWLLVAAGSLLRHAISGWPANY